MHPRARHSQEYFLPPRRGFNLRCTRERDIPKNVFFLREEVLIYDAPSLPRKDNRFDQELHSIRGSKVWRKGLVQWRGLMIWSRSWFRTTGKGRERVTGFPYISPISSGLRWRGERDIPKNAFFLREKVLIYDAPRRGLMAALPAKILTGLTVCLQANAHYSTAKALFRKNSSEKMMCLSGSLKCICSREV